MLTLCYCPRTVTLTELEACCLGRLAGQRATQISLPLPHQAQVIGMLNLTLTFVFFLFIFFVGAKASILGLHAHISSIFAH